MIDRLTKSWIRNASDERAVANGCRFDQSRAEHVCGFFENELRLYEGECAGQPFRLMGWQVELLSRAFGWVRFSDEWGRDIRRFRKVSVWIAKKNGKSPTAAGVGLYLLTADGEKGQKVFSAAKDGKQAGIIHTHARQMILRSPNLSSTCIINKSTGRITHSPTFSFYDILSGENIKGQEGLNGSVVIDETHVVDARLADVLEYMGASRSEPMQFEVSTAGNNPEGYGKRQFDYGQQVERGDVKDDEFLFVSYGVESSAKDEELLDPKTWEACNPSWGVTIKPSEFENSAERARNKGLSDWATFCMYRLNQWQASTCPWLRDGDWQACQRKFDVEDVAHLPAAAGLDLSKTRDMSALNVTWFDDDRDLYLQKTWLWITEKYADANRDKVRFHEWEAGGWLTIIPGETILQSWIKERFSILANQLSISLVCFDKTYGADFREWVEGEWPAIEMVEFPQSAQNMEKPIDDFQARVMEHGLVHDGNPCINWQAGHVATHETQRGHRILAKPTRDDVRKIDGMVASVMGLFGASAMPEPVTGSLFVS